MATNLVLIARLLLQPGLSAQNDSDNLESKALLALVVAVDEFNPERGVSALMTLRCSKFLSR